MRNSGSGLISCLAVLLTAVWLPRPAAGEAAMESMSETGLYQALDLERPDLAAVREAAERKDWAGARTAFVAHLKSRTSPRWYFDWHDRPEHAELPEKPDSSLRTANDALAHRFTVCGVPHTFEGKIDWRFNPTAVPESGMALNHEWTWQFSRHSFWPALGRAYWETGDERYAQEFVDEMTGWVADNPVPVDNPDQGPYSRWRTIEAGIRMGGSWPESFHRFLSSPAFNDEAVVTMVRSMAEHARYLQAHPTHNNWLTMEMSGLYTVGALFPEFREAAEWRRFASERMRQEMDVQMYPDGAQKELSPGYHWVSVLNFCMILNLAQANGLELPAGYQQSLERMFDYVLWLSMPDRGLPPFNDSPVEPGYAVQILSKGFALFPAREDYHWVATGGNEGTVPAHTSYAFPYAGYIVERSGWDTGARYLAFDAGPFGAGHQHEDKLNFLLTAYGRTLVDEGGKYMYDASQWRRYILGPYAHNIVFVDGEGQHRRGAKETYETAEPLPDVWETNDNYDYARGSYGGEFEGFGSHNTWIATHTRRVLFVKNGAAAEGTPGDFWVIADTLTPRDEKTHRYDSVFHLPSDEAETAADALTVRTQFADGANLGIYPLVADGLRLDVVKGQEQPEVQGWLPLRNESETGVRPIPAPTYTVEGAGVKHLLYVFYPVASGRPPEIGVTSWGPEGASPGDGNGAEITVAGAVFRVYFPEDPARVWPVNGESFRGEVWLSRQ